MVALSGLAAAGSVFCSSLSLSSYCYDAELLEDLPGSLSTIFLLHTYDCTFDSTHVCRRRIFPDLSPPWRWAGRSLPHFHRCKNGRQMSGVAEIMRTETNLHVAGGSPCAVPSPRACSSNAKNSKTPPRSCRRWRSARKTFFRACRPRFNFTRKRRLSANAPFRTLVFRPTPAFAPHACQTRHCCPCRRGGECMTQL